MQIVELDLGPPPPSYRRFDEAVAGAEAQPGQAQAKLDSIRLAEARLEGGRFGASSCLLTFSNGLHVVAFAEDFRVTWQVFDSQPPPISLVPPRQLRFTSGMVPFDPCSMLAAIAGSKFHMLAVTGRDLLVYTRGNEILWLSAYRERESGDDLLYAFFET
jgi:hypothetical protein